MSLASNRSSRAAALVRRTAACGACLMLAATTVSAQSPAAWSAVGDFGVQSNPNGAWSYETHGRSGGYTLMGVKEADFCRGIRGFACWASASDDLPFIGINVAGNPFQFGTVVFAENVLMMHPNFVGGRPVVTWTAPAAGTYGFAGQFQTVDVFPTGVEVAVQVAGKVLMNEILLSRGATAPFDLKVKLDAGKKVRFWVDSHGDVNFDSTGLKVIVLPLD